MVELQLFRRFRRAKYDEIPSALTELVPKKKHRMHKIPGSTNHRISRRRGRPQDHLKTVSNGNYFRIKIPPKQQSSETTIQQQRQSAQILQPQNLPKNLPPATAMAVAASPMHDPPTYQTYAKKLLKWFRENLPVLTLNFGSICILFGFSRSDVMELRLLTMTGQVTFAIYNLAQQSILWPAVAWSTTFASVNGYKIRNLYIERNAEVNLTDKEEDIYVTHFMPHGVTPKQFERILQKAELVKLKKGDYLIRKGDILDHLFLVVEGSTHAHHEGQTLVAASTYSDASKGDQLEGGDSGSWIGELTFLDRLWEYEQGLIEATDKKTNPKKPGLGLALYTILADTDDCTVMTWTHSDMTGLMESSRDLKSALARAMTSAVVAKVINLTVTHNSKHYRPSWSRWLSDWRRSDGSEVHIQDKLRATKEGAV